MWIAAGLISQTTGECARIADVDGSKKLKTTVRHLSVAGIDGFPVDAIKSLSQFKNLRTIIIEDCNDIQDDTAREVEKVIESLKALRVVQSNVFSRSRFPGKEANLKHLRYSEGFCDADENMDGVQSV
uniref:Uncharacterized protein n=1 Tax=Oryza punctata TaxID=4537 RepID=A0A0E0MKL6_ORYPU